MNREQKIEKIRQLKGEIRDNMRRAFRAEDEVLELEKSIREMAGAI